MTPIATGDGLLARLPLPAATLALEAIAELCAAAHRYANGAIEITARGNLQVRGLRADAIQAFATSMAALGLRGLPAIPVSTNPLAGLAPDRMLDLGGVVDALRTALTSARLRATLAAKVTVVVDDGGLLHLDALPADVRLRATATTLGPSLKVAVGGDGCAGSYLGRVAVSDAVDAVLRLLDVLAQRGARARARDIIGAEGLVAFRTALAGLLRSDTAIPQPRPAAEAIGVHALHDGTVALGIALPFGHIDQGRLATLIGAAKAGGAAGLRTASRALLVVGLAPAAVAALQSAAAQLGFVVTANDPRRHIIACAGAPFCAAAEIPARALAPAIAQHAAALLDGSLTIHVSGCPKSCAWAGQAALTLVGQPGGRALVVAASAPDAPVGAVDGSSVPAFLAAVAAEVERDREPGEAAADVLSGQRGRRILSRNLAGDRRHG
jgi:precorrin-3B synthase